jgi:thioredoxin-like negative regulator of GroEL
MTFEERLEAVAVQLDTLTRIHIDNDREFRDRFERLTQAQNVRDIEALKAVVAQDTDNIRARIRIAELHHERLNRLEDR